MLSRPKCVWEAVARISTRTLLLNVSSARLSRGNCSTLVEETSSNIIVKGATVVAPAAGDVAQELGLAVAQRQGLAAFPREMNLETA